MKDRTIHDWRLRGPAFDPQRRALSRGEQRALAVDALIYGTAGVIGAAMVLYAVTQAVWR